MNLLITGGAGYIGSHVVLSALENNYDVTIFDDLSNSNQTNINLRAKFVRGSTQSKEDLTDLFEKNSYDGVIHLAASKAAGESMLNPEKYTENNIIGSLNLINKCIQYKVKAFVLSSSAAVYGNPKYLPVDESHPTNPINYYGYTKLSIEKSLKWYSNLHCLNYASLRYFNAAGYDHKKRVLGKEKKPENLIPIIMEAAIGKRSFVKIYGDKYRTRDGTAIRDYVHVCDLAKAHIKAYEYILKKRKNLILNLGAEEGFSVFEVLNMAKRITNVEIRHKIYNSRLGDVDAMISSSDLAKNLIKWNRNYSSLRNIIQSTWKIYK